MHLLLVGAFSFPVPQGSQVYFQEQAIALQQAGVEISLATYGPPPDQPGRTDRLDGLHILPPRRWASPRTSRSGPKASKIPADLGLIMTLRDAIASSDPPIAYDAILAHHAEAASISIALRHRFRTPVIYCVHTLLGEELEFYLKSSNSRHLEDFDSNRRAHRSWANRLGARIDNQLARHSDGWIALTPSSGCVMSRHTNRPGRVIPPPIPPPKEPPEPGIKLPAGLEPNRFLLYSGNLDGYQEVGLLIEALVRLRAAGEVPLPIVVATHDLRAEQLARRAPAGLIVRRPQGRAEMAALERSARASLLMRRSEGGFPIKLANTLAAGIAPIVFLGTEWGLEDGRNAWVCSPSEPIASLARAIMQISQDAPLASKLGIGARRLFEARHRPEIAARETLEVVHEVLEATGRARRRSDGP